MPLNYSQYYMSLCKLINLVKIVKFSKNINLISTNHRNNYSISFERDCGKKLLKDLLYNAIQKPANVVFVYQAP